MTPVVAVDSRLVLAVAVAGGLALFLVLVLVLTGLAERAGMIRTRRAKIPAGMRPGPSDQELERRVLERYLGWGAVVTVFFAIFLPIYWLYEPTRLKREEVEFLAKSVERGRQLYAPSGDFLTSVGCAECHGNKGEGGVRQFTWPPGSKTSTTYAEPPLSLLVARYKAAGKNDEEIRQILRDAIERGRPGTPMPTWSLQFGGPLNAQQVDDLINFLLSEEFQETPPEVTTTAGKALFEANCAICHGVNGSGIDRSGNPSIAPNLRVEFQRNTYKQIFDTIFGGRLNPNRPSMPAWAHLGKKAIEALVEFIRSIQVGAR